MTQDLKNNYQFLCEHCGYKRFTNGTDLKDLYEIKSSPIPGGAPVLDPTAKKITVSTGIGNPSEIFTGIKTKSSQKQTKKFKCPKCGFAIKAHQIQFQEPTNDIKNNNPDGSQTSP